MKIGLLSLAALLLAAGAVHTAAAAGAEARGKAIDILARTRSARGTYALYIWNRLTPQEGPAREEWSAEFNAGDLHRVETPRDRLVANCRTGKGYAYSVETGQSFEGPFIARTACGIDVNAPFLAIDSQGEVATPFGRADRVQVTTAELVRRYDVSPEGILLRTVYAENSAARTVRLVNWAVAVERALPAPNMFDRASLVHSYVPDRFKRRPAERK